MDSTAKKIYELKHQLGPKLTIIGHHYQHDEIIRHTQITGDSLELSQQVAGIESENIVFCGVHFMAESAALLARPGQKVYIPDPGANCFMALMAPHQLLDTVLQKLNSNGEKVLPLAYVNTSLAVKAVVGKYGGAVCTSANAERMLRWAFEQSSRVLFLPDKSLGQNIAKRIGLPVEEQEIIDIRSGGSKLNTGSRAKLLLWPGQCAIHAKFDTSQISGLRKQHPGIKIAVHPESPPAVVDAADAAGSTSFLIRYVDEAPAGSVLGIGTEINLVQRLAREYNETKKVIPLLHSACSEMAKTTPAVLMECLQDIVDSNPRTKPVTLDQQLASDARDSLTRMLEVCEK